MAATMESGTQTSENGSDDESTIGNKSPRAVIDTSPPFNSVEEAVIRFGGRGFWVPRSNLDLPLTVPQECDIHTLEERTATVLKDLDIKEHKTLAILKQLKLTKRRLVEELNLKLPIKDTSDHLGSHDREYAKKDHIDLIKAELKLAKLDLFQNTNDLAAIRASVESLGRTMETRENEVVEKTRERGASSSINPLMVSKELRELNYEAERFMKTAESARSEVLKAMSEIEETKSSLRVVEMRWVAARAARSLALAEIRSLKKNESMVSTGRISLSVEEYSALKDKARKPSTRRLLDANELEFVHNECNPPLRRQTTSIGDILSRKLVPTPRDEFEAEEGTGRQRVSLNQMLCQQRGETSSSPPKRIEKDDGRDSKSKHFFSRKAFGFVHISLPMQRHAKSKIETLNMW